MNNILLRSSIFVFIVVSSFLSIKHVSSGTWSANVENDRIANTDHHYTNGVRLGWVSDAEDGSDLPIIRDTLQMLYPLADVHGGSLVVEIGHNMYTPADTEARNLITNDRPYAGWIYASGSL